MNLNEFKAWFAGYIEGRGGDQAYPNLQQWEIIRKKIDELEEFTTHVPSNWVSTTDTVTRVEDVHSSHTSKPPHHVHGGIANPYGTEGHPPGIACSNKNKIASQSLAYGGSSKDESGVQWKNNTGV